jgi:hypothetical protein
MKKTPWKTHTWDGALCLLEYPDYPTENETSTTEYRLKIDDETLFLENSKNFWDKSQTELPACPDPSIPKNSFSILPARFNTTTNTITLLSKNWTLTWEHPKDLSAQNHPTWNLTPQKITAEEILPSVLLAPTPHKTFLEDCLLATKIEKTNLGRIDPKPWPENLHLSWLVNLERSQAKPNPYNPLLSNDLTESPIHLMALPRPKNTVYFPKSAMETNRLIKQLKRGIIISMALQAPQELPLAKKFLASKKKENPTDNTWKSLANLAEK